MTFGSNTVRVMNRDPIPFTLLKTEIPPVLDHPFVRKFGCQRQIFLNCILSSLDCDGFSPVRRRWSTISLCPVPFSNYFVLQ